MYCNNNINQISLRPANEDDCYLLWEWVNDPQNRKASFSQEFISWENHQKWFHNKLKDLNCYLFIAINTENQSIGQVRFEAEDCKKAEISISVSPLYRGLGYGSLILNQGLQKIFEETDIETVIAWIKPDNFSSQRIFEKANFSKVEETTYKGELALKYQKSK